MITEENAEETDVSRPSRASRASLLAALGVFFAGLTLTALLSFWIQKEIVSSGRTEFNFVYAELRSDIIGRMAANVQVLRSGAALFDSQDEVSRAEWKLFCERLRVGDYLPGTQGLGFAALVPQARLGAHLAEIRGQGFPDYRIYPPDPRPLYTSIIYLEPFTGRNLRAFGYDMYTDPVRRMAMESARDHNEASLTGRVTLVQENGLDMQVGTLMYFPVYARDMPVSTVAERRLAIRGWVYSPFRMRDFMQGALSTWDARLAESRMRLQVYDGAGAEEGALLYDSQEGLPPQDRVNSDGKSRLAFLVQEPLDLDGHRWTVSLSQYWPRGLPSEFLGIAFVGGGGAVISVLLAVLLLSILGRRDGAVALARKLTMELRDSEEKFRVLFENEIYAVCIWDIETGRLLDANAAHEGLYGYTRAELLAGMTFLDLSAEPEATSRSVERTVREGTTFIPLRRHRRKDGSIFPVEIVSGPYLWRGRKVMFVLAHEITARFEAQEALKTSEAKLSAILRNSRDALGVQVSGTWEMCNPAALQMFRASSPAELLGTKVLACIAPAERARMEGALSQGHRGDGVPDSWITRGLRLDGQEFDMEVSLSSYVLEGVPHELVILRDITERKRMEREVQTQRDFAMQIVNAMGQGLTVTDPEENFVFVNPAFAQLFGYASADLIGKSPLDVTDPESREILAQVAVDRLAGRTSSYESLILRAEGTKAPVLITGVPLGKAGGYMGSIAVITDLSAEKRMQSELRSALAENRALLNELQHRVKNSFSMISSMVHLAGGDKVLPETNAVLRDLVTRVSAISELYTLLYTSGSFSAIRLDSYCSRIAGAIIGLSKSLVLEEELEPVMLPARYAAPLGLILTELVTNVQKYAYPSGQGGRVALRLRRRGQGFRLEVQDDGPGLAQGFDPERDGGMGLKLVLGLARQVQAELRLEGASPGAHWVLDLEPEEARG